MRNDNLQFGDLIDLEGLKKPVMPEMFEVVDGGEEVRKTVTSVMDKIEDNVPIAVSDLGELVGALGKKRVSYFGDDISYEEYRKIPPCNSGICSQLERGGQLHPGSASEITYLPVRTARILKQTHGKTQDAISLPTFKTISLDLAHELGGYGHGLNLDGLTDLTVEIARGLVRGGEFVDEWGWAGLSFAGLTTLKKEVATELLAYRGAALSLCGLETIEVDVLEELAKFPKYVVLDKIFQHENPNAEILALLGRSSNFIVGQRLRELLRFRQIYKKDVWR